MGTWKQSVQNRLNDLEDYLRPTELGLDLDKALIIAARIRARRAEAERPECEFKVGDRLWWWGPNDMQIRGRVEGTEYLSRSNQWDLVVRLDDMDIVGRLSTDCHHDRRRK